MNSHSTPRILTVFISTLLVLSFMSGAAEQEGASAVAKKAATPSEHLLRVVMGFRQQAQTQPDAAFVRYGGSRAKAEQLFGTLGHTLCPTSDPAKGWSYFFETAVWNLRCINFTTAAAVFYHPYSDVALITTWTRNDAGIILTDAELLMGDALRNQGKPPFTNDPHWTRGEQPAYLAVGVSSAKTLRATAQIFSSITKSAKGGWRSAYPALSNASVMEANRMGVGVMFEGSLAGRSKYLTDSSMEAVRNQTQEVLKQIGDAHFDMVYQLASETRPHIRPILEKYPEQLGHARVITCVTKRDAQNMGSAIVLLGIPNQPEFIMSLWFQAVDANAANPVLKRIDLIDQNATYKYLDLIEKMTKESNMLRSIL